MAKLLPIFLDLDEQNVLLVGGHDAALEKLHKLAPTGARVKLVARHISDATRAAAISYGNVTLVEREWRADDLNAVHFIVSAVDDLLEHERLAAAARAAKILINTVDAPSTTDCYFGAQVERGPLLIAISTQGKFPGLARAMRLWIDELLPAGLGADIEELAALRKSSRSILPEATARMIALKEQLSIWLNHKQPKQYNESREA